jgi:hypothetical protein
MARLEAPSQADKEGSWGLMARLQTIHAGLGRGSMARASDLTISAMSHLVI